MRRWHGTYSGSMTSMYPKNSTEGYIEIQDINKVLTLNIQTRLVGFETQNETINANQKWKLGPKMEKGWQTIQHVQTNLYLTTNYKDKSSFLTVKEKGKVSEDLYTNATSFLIGHDVNKSYQRPR